MENLNWWAVGWSAAWVIFIVLLGGQLLLQSIPDGDSLFIAVDAAAIVFVVMKLRGSLRGVRRPKRPPDRP